MHGALVPRILLFDLRIPTSPVTRNTDVYEPALDPTLLPALTVLSLSRLILFSELNTRGRPIWQSTTRDVGRRSNESRQPEPDAGPTVSRSEASIPRAASRVDYAAINIFQADDSMLLFGVSGWWGRND
jgi:hypothetical protein